MQRSKQRSIERYEDLPPAADERRLREAGVAYEPETGSDRIDLGEIERLSRQRLWEPVLSVPKGKRDRDDFEPAPPAQERDRVEGL